MRTGCWEPDERGEQGEHAKNATFTTYPQESKGLVNKVNVARGYFDFSRTSHAKLRRLEGVSGAGSPASAGVAVTGVVRRGSRRRNPKTGAPQQSRFWIVGVEDVGITSFLTSLVCLISTRSQSRSEINLRGSQRNFEISLRSRPVSPLDFEITLF
jgi:hypothetical protein